MVYVFLSFQYSEDDLQNGPFLVPGLAFCL